MLIFHSGGHYDLQRSPEAMQENMGKWMAWIDKLKKEGKYLGGEPLLPGGKLVKGADKKVTDGPYTEGKEIVGGFFLLDCKTKEEAIAIANECPAAEWATVEVREVGVCFDDN